MLHFAGDETFNRPPTEVFTRLSDAPFLTRCIPGVESVTVSEPHRTAFVIRPGFSFVRGTLEITLQVVEADTPSLVRVRAHGKGIGSSNDVEAVLNLTPQDGTTRVHWTADVTNLGGLLKAVPHGLIRGAAQKVIAETWEAVRAQFLLPDAANS
jgi:carbon monoxide dehydrogenase subunit G